MTRYGRAFITGNAYADGTEFNSFGIPRMVQQRL